MLEAWKKKRVLKKHLEVLPIDLAQRYGAKECYSTGQLEKTLNDLKYPTSYRGYAAAIYLGEEDALEYFGNPDIAKALVAEIAGTFYNGDSSFKVSLAKQRAVGNTGHCSIGADPAGTND